MINEADIPAEVHAVLTLLLCIFMVSAVYTDIRENRIKNFLVVLVLLVGLLAHLVTDTTSGLLTWGTGLAIGGAIFLPFYAGGGMGAGDVKLMAAVAAFLGPIGGVIACGATLVAGLPLAIFYMVKRRLQDNVIVEHGGTKHTHTVQSAAHLTDRIPYAAAIFAGTAVGLWWTGRFDPLVKGLLS
jgi:prepilin peptidase CpaA